MLKAEPKTLTELLIFRAVAAREFQVNPRNPRNSPKHAKSRKISSKSNQIHVGTIYLKVILAVGVAYLL